MVVMKILCHLIEKRMTNLHRYLTKITTRQLCLMDVKKSQEQKEDFELFKGFNLPLPMSNLQSFYATKSLDKSRTTLHPLVAESVSDQILLTRQMKFVTTAADKYSRKIFDSLMKFQEYFRQNHFERLIGDQNGKNDETQLEKEKLNSIDEILLGIVQNFKNETLNISTTNWKHHKTRFIFVKHCGHANISKVFCDEEQDLSILIKKYKNKAELIMFCCTNGLLGANKFTSKIVDKINAEAKEISDDKFVSQIFDLNNDMVTDNFLTAYKEWRGQIIQNFKKEVEKNITAKINKNFEMFKKSSEKHYFGQIETMYATKNKTRDCLTILDLQIDENKKRYCLECEIPEKLCLTIYNINLDQPDMEEMDKNEFFVPKPTISNYPTSFYIDPETYEFRKIIQFGRKYLLFLWNVANDRLDIYLDSIKNLQHTLKSQTPQKKLTLGKNFTIAINEPKGMIAIYENDKGLLNTYSFDEEQHDIHLQYRNIQINQWYNLSIPKIAHFFFIKNTEDVCFVEKNGQARIYSLVNSNFRPGTAQLPGNCTQVMSTPDGTCFVAFVKEKLITETSKVEDKVENTSDIKTDSLSTNDATELSNIDVTNKNNEELAIISQTNLDSSTESEIQKHIETSKSLDKVIKNISENIIDNITKNNKELATIPQEVVDDLTESKLQQDTMIQSKTNNSQILNRNIVRGYVFFLENFSKNANKVIEVSFPYPTTEFFQFFLLPNKQVHLITVDLHNKIFQSLMVKVTQVKAKYRFERKTVKKSLGKVKIESNCQCTAFGQSTKFTNDLHVGDFLVIDNEKFQIMEVVNDSELKIINQQKIDFGEWRNFKIEPRTKMNGLFDVYSMVFTKYAVENPFGKNDEPLKLTIMDLSSKLDINYYKTKFQAYFRKLFEKYEKETKKPMGHPENFDVNCIMFESFNNLVSEFTKYKLGNWIIDFFCLIPIQIAVAHDNEFIPIRDGFLEKTEQNVFDDGFGLIGNISKTISFGWYETIFEFYADLEVKVISSMGEQSCGKSYLLNHCLGSTFDGSAMACFCIVIKDVAMVDREGVVEEFYLKFSKIVDKEDEDNFISKLYRSKMSITAWPVFNDPSFYTSLNEFKSELDEQESQYKNARIFLEKAKNRDDGTSIPDNDVFLSEIFDNMNDTTKINNDTELILFEEKGKFTEISSSM
ncbi:e3 ubiquitin-protein ligase trip12 [Gigaspora margarita]|uniref:E3 ubiquitin-protein ligase trip12 n=1 Tax=Gigaspora margarita TaxID=4874 RepID=A0A8H4A4Y4_GIGMA|nr:e3 ubiquitin-protein ligase trip12 [Gigaspora margarita]